MVDENNADEYDTDYFDQLENQIKTLRTRQVVLFVSMGVVVGFSFLQAKLVKGLLGTLAQIAEQQNEIVTIVNSLPLASADKESAVSEPVYAPNGYDPGPQDIPPDIKEAIAKDEGTQLMFFDEPPVT